MPAALGAVADHELAPDWHDRRAHQMLIDGDLHAELAADDSLVRQAGRLLVPWQRLPRLARASDAVALRRWYTAAAIGEWSRATTWNWNPDTDPQDPTTWPQASAHGDTAAACAVAVARSVPYWLPANEAAGFADSEPLDEHTDDLRMPFDRVLLAFAQPLRIEPEVLQVEGQADLEQMEQFEDGLDSLTKEKQDPSLATAVYDVVGEGATVSAQQVVAVRGLVVEGLVVLATPDGKLRDEFIWLVALPSAVHGTVAGRVAVPAQLSACSWAGHVRNLAAAAAWGDWRVPEEAQPAPGVTLPPGAGSSSRGGSARSLVRVLDVTRTNASGGRGRPTGRTVAPHLRRGHWRRQWYGPGKLQMKRVRIPPVLVNAGLGEPAAKVYRLPPAGDQQVRERRRSSAGQSSPAAERQRHG